MDMADYIINYKKEHNIGNKRLAQQIGINERTIVSIINRRKTPLAKTCYKISLYFNVNFLGKEEVDSSKEN